MQKTTLKEYLQKQGKRIIAINGFRTDDDGELVPCRYDENKVSDWYIITPWSITFYDVDREPLTRFKFEGSELSDIDTVLSDDERETWMSEFDDIPEPKPYEPEEEEEL